MQNNPKQLLEETMEDMPNCDSILVAYHVEDEGSYSTYCAEGKDAMKLLATVALNLFRDCTLDDLEEFLKIQNNVTRKMYSLMNPEEEVVEDGKV